MMADQSWRMSGTGRVFDVLEEDILPDSFRQYVLTNLMLAYDKKAYMTTTGYNRVELDLNQALSAEGSLKNTVLSRPGKSVWQAAADLSDCRLDTGKGEF